MPPTTVIAAIACSAAAGKNPWVPIGLLCLLAAPEHAPAFLMDPGLHSALHGIAPPGVLGTIGVVCLVLAVLESLADKLPVVDKWLVPVSTTFKPFASVAIAAVFALAPHGAAANDVVVAAKAAPALLAADFGLLAGSLAALTIALGFVYGSIAAVGKAGTRLLLAWIPLPGLRFAHSVLDDLFAVGATLAGLAHPASAIVAVIALVYLVVGLFLAPMLGRLAWIQVRIGVALAAKSLRQILGRPPRVTPVPGWLRDLLAERGIDAATAGVLPAYALRVPVVGRCRGGHVVLHAKGVLFVSPGFLSTRVWDVPLERLARVGLAETTTARAIVIGEKGAEPVELRLLPATQAEVLEAIERGAAGAAGLAAVRPDSASARAMLPARTGERFLPAEQAGSLRVQALVTIAAAAGVGFLTAGIFVPIGAGYLLSPYKRRFVFGLALSSYLALCTVGTLGLGAPAAVLYAALLNSVALRDLARCACKVRVEGIVDRRAFLPLVCGRVWIPETAVLAPGDRARAGDPVPIADGPWRTVAGLLAAPPSPPPSPPAGERESEVGVAVS